MKKVLAIILASLMLFAFAGCGGDVNADDAKAVSDYVEKLTASEQFKQTTEGAKNASMDLKIEARGDDFVYIYTYTIELPEGAEAALKSSLGENESLLKSAADTIRKDEPAVDEVIWEYRSSDGKAIATLSE